VTNVSKRDPQAVLTFRATSELVTGIGRWDVDLIDADERITAALHSAARALSIKELRPLCRVRNATLYERLAALTRSGQLLRTPEGYRLAARN